MSVHLQREIEKLKKQVFSLCAVVEDQVQMAVRAVLQRDRVIAEGVEHRDADIDHQEVTIEEECLKILALHQPVAIDLRLIIASLKMNNDLERIGDEAVTIARQAAALAAEPAEEIPFDLAGMWSKTQAMLRDSLDALVNMDTRLAADVCARDDEVDQIKRDFRLQAEKLIRAEPQRVGTLQRLLAVSRSLERIADLATNIAEDAIYMIQGKIIRHRKGV
jgi:phosphate transport system protein